MRESGVVRRFGSGLVGVAAGVAVVVLPIAPAAAAAAKPAVSSLSPNVGAVAGGRTILVTGSGFAKIKSVRFGSTAARGFRVVSATRLSVVVPARPAGTVALTVKTTRGVSATTARSRYTFVAPPVVVSTTPRSGPSTGGTVVSVRAARATGISRVLFGTTAATSVSVKGNVITATAPKRTTGPVAVRLVGRFGTSAPVSAGRYTYTAPAPPRPTWSLETLPASDDGPGGGSLSSVQCFVDGTCVAAGIAGGTGYEPDLGGASLSNPVFSTRANGVWRSTVVPMAPRETMAGAGHLSCVDPTHCGVIEGRDVVAVLDGKSWTVTKPPPADPSEAVDPLELVDLTCPAANVCYALGSYYVGPDQQRWVIDTLRDGQWTVTKLQLPDVPERWRPRITDISCASVTTCLAVGYAPGPFQPESGYPFVVEGGGTSWRATSVTPPTPPASGRNDTMLNQSICTPADCSAWGKQYTTDEYHPQLLGARKTNGSWSSQVFVGPPGTRQETDQMSCPGSPPIGCSYPGTTDTTRLFTFAGNTWRASAPLEGNRTQPPLLSNVSCVAGRACTAVGEEHTGTGPDNAVAIEVDPERPDDVTAARVPVMNPLAPLTAVSCGAPEHCLVTGRTGSWTNENYYEVPVIELLDGSARTSLTPVLPADADAGPGRVTVGNPSCATATYCVVPGTWSSEPRTLGGDVVYGDFVDVYDGTSFTPMALPGFGIRDLDCPSPGRCHAVGYLRDGNQAVAAELRDGVWTTTKLVDPAGGTEMLFRAISCADTSHCTAVGVGDETGATVGRHMIVQTLAGSSWSGSTLPATAGFSYETPFDVSCAVPDSCTLAAVARNDDDYFYGAFTGRPGSWQASVLPDSLSSGPDTYGPRVSCATATSCTLIVDHQRVFDEPGPPTKPFAYVLTDGRWRRDALSPPTGASAMGVLDVSCVSPTKCLAVGVSQYLAAEYSTVVRFE